MPLVTIIYVLANVAYLAVLTPHDMVTTKAIAVVSEIYFYNLHKNHAINIVNTLFSFRLLDTWQWVHFHGSCP